MEPLLQNVLFVLQTKLNNFISIMLGFKFRGEKGEIIIIQEDEDTKRVIRPSPFKPLLNVFTNN